MISIHARRAWSTLTFQKRMLVVAAVVFVGLSAARAVYRHKFPAHRPLVYPEKKRRIDDAFLAEYVTRVRGMVNGRAPNERPQEPVSGEPIFAIGLGATSRSLMNAKGHDAKNSLKLFTSFLPSLMPTLEPGIAYRVYVGYDRGDPYFDSDEARLLLSGWVRDHGPGAGLASGVSVEVIPVAIDNPVRKPGLVFNVVMGCAYEDGADYLSRVNDDSVYLHDNKSDIKWSSLAIAKLQAMNPPNIGVLGPECLQGNRRILIHDIVHRTHCDIFGGMTYYPPSLLGWYMDEWISFVYGQGRTSRGPFSVGHTQGAEGQVRYVVDASREEELSNLLKEGERCLAAWLNAGSSGGAKSDLRGWTIAGSRKQGAGVVYDWRCSTAVHQ